MSDLKRDDPADMAKQFTQTQRKIDVLRLMIDSHDRAALMLTTIEGGDEAQGLHHRLAATFRVSVELIKELRRELQSRQPANRLRGTILN
jgi:hypothetical protein